MDKISERDDISVGLLIGVNCAKALEALNIITSCDWLVLQDQSMEVIERNYHAVVYQ